MIIIDDIRIKDNYAHNLPENRDLLRYARENRRAGNLAEIALRNKNAYITTPPFGHPF